MDRVILHVDINNCYASIECLHRPEMRNKPVVVGGDEEARHGIVLAKNYIAKAFDIKTGETLWQARQKCKDLVVVPPNYPLYLRFSKLAREIYTDYSSQFEPFGIDEGWLDVTGSIGLFGSGEEIAEIIRERIKFELGITVSIGVSFNKIFAKLGSDMKKPDAITVITKENFREKVWPLPVGELLYVGHSTEKKLRNYGINTIGYLATTPPDFLFHQFGKWGGILSSFANGLDDSPVCDYGYESPIKSIGNSTTTSRDLENNDDAKIIIYVLSESVAARMREQGFKCNTVSISIRDKELNWYQKQGKVISSTDLASEIQAKAMELFKACYQWQLPVRNIGVRATDFVGSESNIQLLLYTDENKRERQKDLEKTVDSLRSRFGAYAIQRGVMLSDRKLSGFSPKDDHIIHRTGYF